MRQKGCDFVYLYQRLKELREKCGESQAEVAQLLGTVRQQYAKYESGVQELPMHHFITLAEHYGVTIDYLAGRGDTSSKPVSK